MHWEIYKFEAERVNGDMEMFAWGAAYFDLRRKLESLEQYFENPGLRERQGGRMMHSEEVSFDDSVWEYQHWVNTKPEQMIGTEKKTNSWHRLSRGTRSESGEIVWHEQLMIEDPGSPAIQKFTYRGGDRIHPTAPQSNNVELKNSTLAYRHGLNLLQLFTDQRMQQDKQWSLPQGK